MIFKRVTLQWRCGYLYPSTVVHCRQSQNTDTSTIIAKCPLKLFQNMLEIFVRVGYFFNFVNEFVYFVSLSVDGAIVCTRRWREIKSQNPIHHKKRTWFYCTTAIILLATTSFNSIYLFQLSRRNCYASVYSC